MQLADRIFLATIVFGLGFWLVASLAFPLFAFGTPRAFRITTGLICAALVTVPVWRASADALWGRR
jgi:type IV secretory pathway TrbD component